MTQNSYAPVGCATVILGGAGLLFLGGGQEMLQNGRPLGWLVILGGLAIWGLLAFLWLINIRANQRRAWLARQPYAPLAEKGLKRGGFWKGAIITWMLVATAHAAAYFAVFQPGLPADLRTPVMSLAYGILPLCHLVVPVVGGLFYGAWVSSSTPKS